MTTLATSYVDWGSMWKILVISVIAGAGVVTVFSVGLVSLSASGYLRVSDADSSPVNPGEHNVAALVGAVVCGLIVIAGVGYGVYDLLAKS